MRIKTASSKSPYIFNLRIVKFQRKIPPKHQQTIYYFYSQFKIQYSFITPYKFYGGPFSRLSETQYHPESMYSETREFLYCRESILPYRVGSAKYRHLATVKFITPPRFGQSGPRRDAHRRYLPQICPAVFQGRRKSPEIIFHRSGENNNTLPVFRCIMECEFGKNKYLFALRTIRVLAEARGSIGRNINICLLLGIIPIKKLLRECHPRERISVSSISLFLCIKIKQSVL